MEYNGDYLELTNEFETKRAFTHAAEEIEGGVLILAEFDEADEDGGNIVFLYAAKNLEEELEVLSPDNPLFDLAMELFEERLRELDVWL